MKLNTLSNSSKRWSTSVASTGILFIHNMYSPSILSRLNTLLTTKNFFWSIIKWREDLLIVGADLFGDDGFDVSSSSSTKDEWDELIDINESVWALISAASVLPAIIILAISWKSDGTSTWAHCSFWRARSNCLIFSSWKKLKKDFAYAKRN